MKLENILEELSVFGHDRPVPREALSEAARQQEAVTPILLDALDRTWEKLHSEEYEALCEEPGYDLSYYGIFLLGQFREQAESGGGFLRGRAAHELADGEGPCGLWTAAGEAP